MRGTLSLVLAAAVLAGCALRPGPPGSEVRVSESGKLACRRELIHVPWFARICRRTPGS